MTQISADIHVRWIILFQLNCIKIKNKQANSWNVTCGSDSSESTQWNNLAEIKMLFKNQPPIGTCLQAYLESMGPNGGAYWQFQKFFFDDTEKKTSFKVVMQPKRAQCIHCVHPGAVCGHIIFIFFSSVNFNIEDQHYFKLNSLLFLCKGTQRTQVIISLFIFLVRGGISILMVNYIIFWIFHKSSFYI